MALTLALLWILIRRNDKDAALCEHLRIWPDLIAVHRHEPKAADRYWSANSYWVTARIKDTQKTEAYLTQHGGPRDIELGAFLDLETRRALYQTLQTELTRAKQS